MRADGVHEQPAGTWSDDSSLSLCSTESLLECRGLDTEDMGRRFVSWKAEAVWAAHGTVFDIGGTTACALRHIASGTPAESAGGTDEHSNGNGSLMRILPIALWFAGHEEGELLSSIHRVSGITHRHLRSQMACGFYALLVRELLAGSDPAPAYASALSHFKAAYAEPCFSEERLAFRHLEAGDLASVGRDEIKSGGYVIETLTASIWCLLTSKSYKETVLKAVNLGSDTDTTACVAGGLAGLVYGKEMIPPKWIAVLAQTERLNRLFQTFAEVLSDQIASRQ